MIDIRQSINYANYLKSQGWTVERTNDINYFIKRLPIIGSVLKLQRPKTIDLEIINRLQKKYKVFQTIIEPNLNLSVKEVRSNNSKLKGFKLSKNPFLPTKSIHLDLNQTKQTIYRNFSKDCKYSIRRGEKLKIKVCSTLIELKNFHEAWKKSVNFNRYVPSLKSILSLNRSFLKHNSLFLTSHNKTGRIIGGALFTISSHGKSNQITYYWAGFTNKEGRTSLSQYALLYQGILWGKRKGCKLFDFEGIYDIRFPIKSWLGFSHFKKSFGGKEITYPGCYVQFRLPF